MRTLMAATLLFVAVAFAASARPLAAIRPDGVQGTEVDRLAWLSGCWIQVRANGVTEEHWMKPLGGSMLGMSRTVVGGKTVEFEFLRIGIAGGTLAYVARPSGQAEVTFPLKSIGDGVVVFENLSHDFPQRIIYRRHANAGVTARIEGTVKGEAQGRDFPYRPCQS